MTQLDISSTDRLAAEAATVIDSHDPPSPSSLRPILVAVLRHLLTAAGAFLVAHGVLDAATADAAVSTVAQELAGGVLMALSAALAAARAGASHNRWADAWAVLTGVATATRSGP